MAATPSRVARRDCMFGPGWPSSNREVKGRQVVPQSRRERGCRLNVSYRRSTGPSDLHDTTVCQVAGAAANEEFSNRSLSWF